MSETKVLIVDDELSIRTTLRSMLARFGYQVDVAENADEALQILSQGAYDVVLSDIVLPRVSGVALLKEIRRASPDVQVIMMTGEPTVESAAEAVRAGAADYLVKPVPREAVLLSVANAARVKALDDERKRLEKENREYLARLERQNEELRRAAQFREEVEAMTRHDLKSPLHVILGMPQLLLDMGDNLTKQQRDDLATIEQAGRRMLDMINSSLDLFRIEHGIYNLHPSPVDLLEVAREVTRHQTPLAGARKISHAILLGDRPPEGGDTWFVHGERMLLYSLLSNLVKNAVEASPPGATVTLRLSGGDERVLAIHNLGAVPAEIRSRFFEKFVTAGKDHGTGLGTYSARLIAEAHGGAVRLDASEEGATTIVVSFPSEPMPDAG